MQLHCKRLNLWGKKGQMNVYFAFHVERMAYTDSLMQLKAPSMGIFLKVLKRMLEVWLSVNSGTCSEAGAVYVSVSLPHCGVLKALSY